MTDDLKTIKEKLNKELTPIYCELLSKLECEPKYKNIKLSSFLVRVGNNYKRHKSVLFVGKATNGWGEIPDDLDELFKYFTSKDQMNWNDTEYLLNRSAFWRIIKSVTQNDQDWINDIAWSNLYKIAPSEGGNPDNALCNLQYQYAKDILETEVKILQPKAVVMLTSDWNILEFTTLLRKEDWGNERKYSTHLYEINGVPYIWSYHPQGKIEEPHADAIIKLLKSIEEK